MASGRNIIPGIIKIIKNPRSVTILLLFLIYIIPYATANWDPYEVIGVDRNANLEQIKRAYRSLARKLHPDKSNLSEDEAGRRFIELNKAFSILKDPNRRSRYDQHGDTEEHRQSRNYNSHNVHRRSREYWTQNGYKVFTFFPSSDGYFREKSISSKQYYQEYVKESRSRPFFIFFYADLCPACKLVESAWIRITNELGKYNIGSFTINYHDEPRLSHELGVSSLPLIVCLIDGQVKPYHQAELSLSNIVKFTKNLLPNNLVTLLKTESDQDRFITLGPQHNRLSAIIIHSETNLRLRYLLIAYELKLYYRFAQISTRLSEYKLFAKSYNLSIDHTLSHAHILVFDEDKRRPVLNLNFKSDNVDMDYLRKELVKWPFLKLPKLSSQQRFDDLCVNAIPKDGEKTQQRLCVILFASDTPSSLPMRRKMIEFTELNYLAKNPSVVFAYMDPLKQSNFVNSLLSETQPVAMNKSVESRVLLIERQANDYRKAHHEWLKARWDPSNVDELDRAKLELYDLVASYIGRHTLSMKSKVVLTVLSDEEGPGLVDRIFWRFIDHTVRILFYLTSRESITTIIMLLLCALIASGFLYRKPSSPFHTSENTPTEDLSSSKPHQQIFRSSCPDNRDDDLKIMELKAETYNGLVRLLKPGFRSIIVLTDRDTRDSIVSKFKEAVWPYRRNKTLSFGYLCLDKNIDWYRSLLQEVLDVDNLKVNKKNCIGTVLSLNGFKKYFRVYHAKHHEIDCYDDETENDGSFLGFNDDCDRCEDPETGIPDLTGRDSSKQPVYTTDNLLDRLPIWLDKMFDGLTKRYFLDNWPEDMK